MKKKIKWIAFGLSVIIVTVVIYIGALVRYAESEETALNTYRLSLEVMPEVDSVLTVHRFNGLESYVVALVELTNHQEVYFFVRDGVVAHYIGRTELMSESQVISVASNLITGGELHQTQLGIIEETPIFEVQMVLDGEMHYVIIHAVSGNVIMNFNL